MLVNNTASGALVFHSSTASYNISSASIVSTISQCRWTSMNTAIASFLFLTLVLNLLAGVVIFRVPLISNRGRSNPVYLCIRFLNVCDIIQALVLLLMPSLSDAECVWLGGNTSCKIWGFAALFLLLVSPLITIMMAFDRVVALYQPFKYRSNAGLKVLKLVLPSSCVFAFVVTALPLAGVGEYHVVKGRRMCLLDTITNDIVDQTYVIMVHSLFLLALLFMVGCTCTFQFKLIRMSRQRKEISSARGNRARNATMTTMGICCIFIICYTPYVIRVIYEASSCRKSLAWITWLTFTLAFLQPLLNPIACLSTNVKYRNQIKEMFRRTRGNNLLTSSDSVTSSRGFSIDLRRRLSTGNGRRFSVLGIGPTKSVDAKTGSQRRCSKHPKSPIVFKERTCSGLYERKEKNKSSTFFVKQPA